MSKQEGQHTTQKSKKPTTSVKQRVIQLEDSLEKVIALRPVTWKWKSEEYGTETQYGFIAQEVEEVIPELVSDGKWHDGSTRRFLNVNDMMPYVVSAIKEQQEIIENLQQKIEKLEKKSVVAKK